MGSELFELNTDTRAKKTHSLFVALKGDRFDAIDFLESILTQAKVLVFDSEQMNKMGSLETLIENDPSLTLIEVSDTVVYLQELAEIHFESWRKSSERRCFGVSGSNGKTTTKEILAYLLGVIGGNKVHYSYSNNNNHLGVPLTILGLTDEHQFLVLELGSNHPGEIKVIADIVIFDFAVTTNIGFTHMEFFEDLEAVFDEESYIYERIAKLESSLFLRNDDCEQLKKLKKKNWVKSFGKDSTCDYQFRFQAPSTLLIRAHGDKERWKLTNPYLVGEHNFTNLGVAFLLSLKALEDKEPCLIERAETFQMTLNRSEWLSWKGKQVFLDAYNANPSSMEVSVKSFFDRQQETKGETLWIIGDMNELGASATEHHERLGRFFSDLGLNHIIFFGQFAECYQKGLNREVICFTNKEDLINYLDTNISSFDFVFVKGSRSLALESIFN
jgi:UDP-N-acetylmuramoyl-tripeptide--D-alanyl-D-alanine ligase